MSLNYKLAKYLTTLQLYTIGGVSFGFIFPMVAILALGLKISEPVSFYDFLKNEYQTNMLLKIIHLAPFILGVTGYFIGKKVKNERVLSSLLTQNLRKITSLKEKLEHRAVELEAVFESTASGIRIVSEKGIVLRANKNFLKLFSVSYEETVGVSSKTLPYVLTGELDDFDEENSIKKIDVVDEEGVVFHMILRTKTLKDSNGKIWAFLEEYQDVTEAEKKETVLYELSTTDDLTGLLNRRGFLNSAGYQLKLNSRLKIDSYLVFIDMDNMKTINDQLGHDIGDKALITVAKILSDCFRETDAIARFGGDEFVVFAGTTSNLKTSNLIEARVEARVRFYNEQITEAYTLSLSLGIVRYDSSVHTSLEELIQIADDKMYSIKKNKKSIN
jgi:diguanylate cyclase (GGDEF)-like protein/PAS domain S-box-containing protein